MNVTEHWIPVKETALFLQVSERAIQIQIERNTANFTYKYIDGIGKGGKQLRILLESLPQEVQDRYRSITPDKPAPESSDPYTSLSDKHRKRVDEKVLAVTEYTKFKRQYHKQGVMREFLKRFSEEHPEINVSMDKLEDWINKYAENGVEGLIDRRGRYNKGSTSLTEEMQNVFKKYYLTDKKPSVHQCYIATKEFFTAKGIEIPSESSFKRYVQNNIPRETISLYRNGIRDFEDNFIPSIFTDYAAKDFYSNSMWVSDHHKCDVLVKYKGKIIRPWLTAFMDYKTRFIVGYIVFPHEPNADIVLDCLALAIKNCGVPETFLTDNGKDYKVHDLFNEDNEYSVVSILQSAVRTALPYNAKAKNIERNFRTLESFNKLLDSYIGDRPENRPTSMKGTNKMIEREEKAMDFEDFKKYMDDVINIYHNTPHSGNGMNDRTPLQAYKDGFAGRSMRILSKQAISIIMRRTTRTVTITKQGVKFAELPDIGYYSSSELLQYGIGNKVFARYSTDNVNEIFVYSEDGKYICTAKNPNLYSYRAGQDVQKQVIRENSNLAKAQRKKAREAYPNDTEVPTIMEVNKRRSAAFGLPDFSKIPKTDYSKEIEMPNGQEDQTEGSEEFAYPEKDYRLDLGNIGKTAM